MNVLCVDDENLALDLLLDYCEKIPEIENYAGFDDPFDALNHAKENVVHVAFLDIDMPGMSGLELAHKLHEINPMTNIIICTAFDEYALDAFGEDCSGYLLKPISIDRLKHQLSILRHPVDTLDNKKVRIQCFGNFEVYVNEKPVMFYYSMTKELFAYLVDRNGTLCTTGQIQAALWEDDNHAEYFKKLRRDLIDTLSMLNISDILISGRGVLGINKENVSCDYYDYLAGKNSDFHEEYMLQYSWAEETAGALMRKLTWK